MAAFQAACFTLCNGDENGSQNDGIEMEIVVDANGDFLKNEDGLKGSSSSEEDIASCSSKDDESDEIIGLKTR